MTLRRVLPTTLLMVLAGCLEPTKLEPEPATAATVLDAARMQASASAPALPVYVLRLARDELALSTADRAGVAMIVDEAEFQARTLDRARAAYLEILAQSVEHGAVREDDVAIFTNQMVWASGMVGPYFAYGLRQLFDILTPEQRAELVATAKARYPLWAHAWAAEDTTAPRWIEGFERHDLSALEPNLVATSRQWSERSAAHVRAILPRLDAGQRTALARSLRLGAVE